MLGLLQDYGSSDEEGAASPTANGSRSTLIGDGDEGEVGPAEYFVGGYPDADEGEVGPAGPPSHFVGGYPDADERGAVLPEGVVIGDDPDEICARERSGGTLLSTAHDEPDEDEKQAAIPTAVPQMPGTADSGDGGGVETRGFTKTLQRAVYEHRSEAGSSRLEVGPATSHMSDQVSSCVVVALSNTPCLLLGALSGARCPIPRQVVSVVKAHSDSEGGGFTIHVPSLGRERMTVAGRLTFDDAAVAACLAEPGGGSDAPAATGSVPASVSPSVSGSATASVAAAARLLPAPWVAQVTPETGDVYFWNPETNETTWDCPNPAASAASAPTATAPPAAAPTATAPPEAAVAPAAAVPSSVATHSAVPSAPVAQPRVTLAAGWAEQRDPHSGAVYFWHMATGATSWEPPLSGQAPFGQTPPGHFENQAFGHPAYGRPAHSQPPFSQPPYSRLEHGQPPYGQPGNAGVRSQPADKPLTGAARREARKRAAGQVGRSAVTGGAADLMDVAHESYSDDFRCMSEDQMRRQKLADARSGYAPRGGVGKPEAQGKALPTPGEILRMNAKGGATAAAAAPKEPPPMRLDTKEDIMKLIAEEDHKAKAKTAAAEAQAVLQQKKDQWRGKYKDQLAQGDKGGGQGGGKSGGKGGDKSGGKGVKRGVAAELSADGSWLNISKKARR